MSQNLTISETGLKLIKAFEGYRPVDRELISGQRIVGYGHRLYSEDAVTMNKREAEEVLLADLEPFEDMINSEVHAPLTQSQFDALCSFAFNIGPKAFLQSDTLRALNNGRPLDAANGLDIWRKSEIDGKTYVVDALMRRRTAEKALFLRTMRDLPAGREDLPPVQDSALATLSTEDALPVFTESDANGVVATVPYDASISPMRRKEDGPAGALQLSERDIVEEEETPWEDEPLEPLDLNLGLDLDLDLGLDDDTPVDDIVEEMPEDVSEKAIEPSSESASPIAAAASGIIARLDALIEDADGGFDGENADWPESLISAEDEGAASAEFDMEDAGEGIEDISSDPDTLEVPENVIDLSERSSRKSEELLEISNEFTDSVSDDAAGIEEVGNPVVKIDALAEDDAVRVRTDSAAKYIETTEPLMLNTEQPQPNGLGIWILVLLGFILIGLAAGAMMKGSQAILGDWGEIISFTGFVIGVGLILAGIYASLRMNRGN